MRLGPSLSALALFVAISACVPSGDLDPPEQENLCDAREDCSAGQVCVAGGCVIGSCEPGQEQACENGTAADVEVCCADREICSPLSLTCEPDPDAPPLFCEPADVTCVQCAAQEECGAGQFCSSGLCLDATGRADCTASFQCADGEHCDRTVFLCVEKRPCATCSASAAHACCFEGEVCIDEASGGVCVEPGPEPDCVDDVDCAAGLVCDAIGRCVECDETHPCSVGNLCDPDSGRCVDPP